MPSEEGGNHPIFYDPEPRVPAGQEQVAVVAVASVGEFALVEGAVGDEAG